MKAGIRSLAAWLLAVSLAIPAAPVRSENLSTARALASDRERIVAFLARPEAQAQLRANGVEAADAQARVAVLTDEEAAQLAARIDELPAGGYPSDLSGAPPAIQVIYLGLLVAVLVVMAVVALVKHAARSSA
jgi:hypothetical protein